MNKKPSKFSPEVRERAVRSVRDGVSTDERERLKALEREVKELRRATEILKIARAFSPGRSSTADSNSDPPIQILTTFVDHHRDTFGVEPLRKVLQIAPSGYRRHAAPLHDSSKRCARARRDESR